MLVSATADRQPFIELLPRPPKHLSNAKITIMLDYRSYPSFFNWWFAFGNKHVILAFSMVLSLLLSIGVVPITAHLFVSAPSQLNSTIPIRFSTTFQDSLLSTNSLQPSIDLATACRTYGANPPPWMTTEYAFPNFSVDVATNSGNITANTTSYSAYLDCESFSPFNSSLEYTGGLIDITLQDRNCDVSIQVGVNDVTPTYASTWRAECTGSEYGRLGIFAGIYNSSAAVKVANYSLISCLPSYWINYGAVTVSNQGNSPPQIRSFEARNTTSFRPELHQTLVDTLEIYKFSDPSNSIQADAFAFSVLSYAQTQNPTSLMMPNVIQDSLEDVFTTFYASLATNLLLQPAKNLDTGTGQLSIPVTRLYVVTPVAYTIVAIVSLIFIFNILLFVYAERSHSILYEQPTGLLGNASIIVESDLLDFVSEFRTAHPTEYKIRDFVNDNYAIKDARCYMDESSGKIRVEGLKERTEKKKGILMRLSGLWNRFFSR